MSTPRFPKRRAATSATSYSQRSRQRRSGAGTTAQSAAALRRSTGSHSSTTAGDDPFSGVTQKWTKVYRYPTSPLDEPYFGVNPSASFQIPMWMRVDELTADEREKYDADEKKKDGQRAVWKEEMEKKKMGEGDRGAAALAEQYSKSIADTNDETATDNSGGEGVTEGSISVEATKTESAAVPVQEQVNTTSTVTPEENEKIPAQPVNQRQEPTETNDATTKEEGRSMYADAQVTEELSSVAVQPNQSNDPSYPSI